MPGKLLLIAKLKGGAGATTSARELACAAVLDGKRVALIDLDGQGSLTRWWSARTKGAEEEADLNPSLLRIPAADIPAAAKTLRRRYDLTIIDSPPSVHEIMRSVAETCDLALIPARPTVDDLAAVPPIIRLLKGAVAHAFVLTQVPTGGRSREGAEALAMLAARGPVIGSTSFRVDYYRPATKGRTGVEDGKVAQTEIGQIYGHLAEHLFS